MNKALLVGVIASTLGFSHAASSAGNVEVLHWWTSGGEAAALNVLKDDLQSKGVSWEDMPVAGGGGEQAMTVLRARVTSKNPPTAAQMLGFDILDWASLGVTADLNAVAKAGGWDKTVPAALQKFSKHNGTWVAAPVNVHSTNWVWANKKIMDELGLAQPTDFDELVVTLRKIKDAGYVALAHGGQAWQDATIFDSVVLATGGVKFYRKAMVELDQGALGGATMKKVFNRMAILRSFVDENFSGRDWNLASAMVINDKAGMQIMGDWAKGEFLNADKTPNKDFMCFRFPGTQGAVTFNSDQFVMFDLAASDRPAQGLLAEAIMSPKFQSAFNVVKGSVPSRTDVPNTAFDACGKKGMADLAEAAKNDKLLGSMAHGHAAPASVKNALYDVVTAHFNGQIPSQDAADELAEAVAAAQ